MGAAGSWGHCQAPCAHPSRPGPAAPVPPHPHHSPSLCSPATPARLPPTTGSMHMLFSGPRGPSHLSLLPEPQGPPLTCLLARTYTFSFSIFTCKGCVVQGWALGCSRPCTPRLPPHCMPGPTWNLCRLSRPGKSSRSPVLMLKQAPCQGQRTRPRDSTPGRGQCWAGPPARAPLQGPLYPAPLALPHGPGHATNRRGPGAQWSGG